MGAYCHHHNHEASQNIAKAFFLNFIFVLIEFVGGSLTGSSAIIADAVHDLGDTLSLGLAWYLQRFSLKKGNEHYSYGYQRFSTLSSLISGVVILCGSTFVIISTLSNLSTNTLPNGKGMFILSILGIVINGWAAWKLAKGSSLNEQMLKWHLIEDCVGWVVILIGSVAIILFKITWLDPLLAITLSAFILFNVARQLIKTFKVLLQAIPDKFNREALKKQLCSIPEIIDVHDIHSWSLDGEHHVLSLHLIYSLNDPKEPNLTTFSEIKKQTRQIIQKLGNYHVTIELESPEENCPHRNDEGPEHFLIDLNKK